MFRILSVPFGFFFLAAPSVSHRESIDCDVIVLGAGAGGIHTAYQLSKTPNSNICVFEKESHVGGRMYDLPHDPANPDLLYGMGALRVMEGQGYVYELAKELGIELEAAPYRDDLINARGQFAFYLPNIAKKETQLYSKMLSLRPPENYFDLRSFSRDVLGASDTKYLMDVSRFRGEFNRPVDAQAFLDYLPHEIANCCVPSYPVGGMSQFAKRMAQKAKENGARIFLAQPVEVIKKTDGESPYLVKTSDFEAHGKRLFIAIDADGFRRVKGSLAQAIQSQPHFEDIFGIQVTVVNQRWPSAWWKESGYEGKTISRAWTTEHCLNFIEIPQNPYAANQLLTRSVYNDEPSCNEFWEHTYKRGGIAAVEQEIERGLKHLFPKANIPKPLNTMMHVWPAAWYWLKGGSQFSIADIAQWALEPIKGEQISLVGDSYFIKRAGWSDAAYQSSLNAIQMVSRPNHTHTNIACKKDNLDHCTP